MCPVRDEPRRVGRVSVTAQQPFLFRTSSGVHIRKELRATVALSGDYDIGVKIDGSFEGWVIEFFQLNCRSSSYTVFFGVPGDNSPGTEARRCSQTSWRCV